MFESRSRPNQALSSLVVSESFFTMSLWKVNLRKVQYISEPPPWLVTAEEWKWGKQATWRKANLHDSWSTWGSLMDVLLYFWYLKITCLANCRFLQRCSDGWYDASMRYGEEILTWIMSLAQSSLSGARGKKEKMCHQFSWNDSTEFCLCRGEHCTSGNQWGIPA